MSRIFAALLLAGHLLARPARAEPVLHEYLPPEGKPSAGRPALAGQLPESIQAGDRAIPRPPADAQPRPDEPGHRSSRTPDRDTSVQLDRTTTHDGQLQYTEEFNPSVVPFKRMTALDSVGEGYSLGLRDATLRPVPVEPGPTPPDHDPFWGTLALSVRADEPVPVPSVSPDARVVNYQATPGARVTFWRDSADNYWLRASVTGRLRLVFLTDAPRHYFSPQVPPLVTLAEVPQRMRPTLPPAVREAAAKVIEHIGARRSDTVYRLLERLVGYFRSFEPGPLTRDSGDTYLDIALSQRGVCRHRSLAFVITAQALGLPARYVHNEAHAFVEVFVPRLGWIRVDLGGASSDLRVLGSAGKVAHNPGPDPFPMPAKFTSGYSQRAGQGDRRRAGQRRPGAGSASARINLRRYDPSTRSPGPARLGPNDGGPRPAPVDRPGTTPSAEDHPGAPAVFVERAPTQLTVWSSTRSAFRGELVQVWGRVSHGDHGVRGLKVEIYLSKDGKTAEVLLGETSSGGDGRYQASLAVPAGVNVGDYRIVAATPGDDKHEAALSH